MHFILLPSHRGLLRIYINKMKKTAKNLAIRYILFIYVLYNKGEYANALRSAPHFL